MPEAASGSRVVASQSAPVEQTERAKPASRGAGARGWALLKRDPVAIVSILVLLVAGLIAAAAPFLGLSDPLAPNPGALYLDVGQEGHLLGTDELGRDILSRLIWGARTSLLMPIIPLLGAVTVGATLGLLAGYFSGWTDTLTMRALDVLLAFPAIVLAIAIAAVLGSGLSNALFAILVVEIPTFARLVRAVTLGVRGLEYVEAARSLGAPSLRIITRHVAPACLTPVLVYATLGFGRVIILAASLSFLGLGVQLPEPDWGSMLDAGRKLVLIAPHVAIIPGFAILLVALAVNMLGDLLQDALDPRAGRGRAL